MEIGFLLHLYQPSTQDESVFRKVYVSCYQPLLRLIKSQKNFKLTINTPLAFLYQMEKYGYTTWLADFKDLIESERVEIVGTGAYHPLLSRLPQKIVEQEIILNECGLANYFGRRSGFEGEAAFMIKDLQGFFPPELAVNEELCTILDSLGYKWVLTDESAIKDKVPFKNVYQHTKSAMKLVMRNKDISNMLSFKRTVDISDFVSAISTYGGRSLVLALDGEFFGHHNTEGIYVLDTFIDDAIKRGWVFKELSELIENTDPDMPESDILESTWGASDKEFAEGNIYPMWDGNNLQKIQWEMLKLAADDYVSRELSVSEDGYENLQIWDPQKVNQIKDSAIKTKVELVILGLMIFESDQLWWASHKTLPTGQVLFYSKMVEQGAQLILDYARASGNQELIVAIEEKIALLKSTLNTL